MRGSVRDETKKKYNDDFKKTIVELYHTGSSVSTLSSKHGLSEITIYKWIKSLTPISEETRSLTPKDIAVIQKENLRMNSIPPSEGTNLCCNHRVIRNSTFPHYDITHCH